jgi:hypothetical protein
MRTAITGFFDGRPPVSGLIAGGRAAGVDDDGDELVLVLACFAGAGGVLLLLVQEASAVAVSAAVAAASSRRQLFIATSRSLHARRGALDLDLARVDGASEGPREARHGLTAFFLLVA